MERRVKVRQGAAGEVRLDVTGRAVVGQGRRDIVCRCLERQGMASLDKAGADSRGMVASGFVWTGQSGYGRWVMAGSGALRPVTFGLVCSVKASRGLVGSGAAGYVTTRPAWYIQVC